MDVGASPPDSTVSPPISMGSLPDSAMSPPDSTDAEAAEMLQIAASVRKTGSAPRTLVRETILKLCSGRYLRLAELARLLDRKPETLRDSYVSSMIREGMLELRYPEKPSHPDQSYRTHPGRTPEGGA